MRTCQARRRSRSRARCSRASPPDSPPGASRSCFFQAAAPTLALPYPTVTADGGTGFGNSRVGVVRGPAQNDVDLAARRGFTFRALETPIQGEFRAEFFNAFYAVNVKHQDGLTPARSFSLGDPGSYFTGLRSSPDSRKLTYIDKRLNVWYLNLDHPAPVKIETDVYFYTASTTSGPGAFLLDMTSDTNRVTRSIYATILRKDLPSSLMPKTDEETALVAEDFFERAQSLAAGLGFALEEAATGGASDGNFTAALGLPTLDGMGAVGAGAHAPHEHLRREHLVGRTALLAAMLL